MKLEPIFNQVIMEAELSKLNISDKDKIVMTKNNKIIPKSVPATNQKNGMKPKGLWYSCGTEWIDWVKSEMPEWEHKHLFKLDIDLKSMLIIDSQEKLIKFHNNYIEKNKIVIGINWQKVAKEYKGIEICPYKYKFRLGYKFEFLWYYDWAVASGCIWDMSAIKNITKLKI